MSLIYAMPGTCPVHPGYQVPTSRVAGDMGQTPGTISPAPIGYVVAGKIRFYE